MPGANGESADTGSNDSTPKKQKLTMSPSMINSDKDKNMKCDNKPLVDNLKKECKVDSYKAAHPQQCNDANFKGCTKDWVTLACGGYNDRWSCGCGLNQAGPPTLQTDDS